MTPRSTVAANGTAMCGSVGELADEHRETRDSEYEIAAAGGLDETLVDQTSPRQLADCSRQYVDDGPGIRLGVWHIDAPDAPQDVLVSANLPNDRVQLVSTPNAKSVKARVIVEHLAYQLTCFDSVEEWIDRLGQRPIAVNDEIPLIGCGRRER